MKKGISDANFIPMWETRKFLKIASEAGFDGVELNFRDEGGDLTPSTSIAEAKAGAHMVKENGLELASLSSGLFNHFALTSGDAKLRNRGEEIGLRMIELADKMGAKVIQIVPGVTTTETPYDVAYNNAAESLTRLGDEALKAGITIGIENVCNKFLPSPYEFTRFLDDINNPAVKAYFDNGNALVTGFPNHFIELLGDRIVMMHVKDYRESAGDFVPILEGDTNWPNMMNALQEIPYKGYLISTPHYPHAYCQDRLIEKYYQDLTSVINLSKPIQNHL